MSGREKPRIYSGASPEEVRRELAPLVDFRDEGMPQAELAALIENRLIPHLMRYDLPGFQSMFNAFPEEGAALGARIALDFNQGVTNWQVSPGGAMLEELCGRALCRLFGFAPEADATFMVAGTYANQQAIYLALHRKAEDAGFDLARKGVRGFPDPARLAVLASADAHLSLRHAVRMLGLGEESLVLLPVDANGRIDLARLEEALSGSMRGRDIVCLVATAGTTSMGAVDPLGPIADLCARHAVRLHVDGAYGLAYALVAEWKALFAGVERAESVVWDPHKQLGVPIPNSVLFVRDGRDFSRMALHGSTFNRPGDDVPNPGLKSPPTTRAMFVLALAASLRRQGLRGLVDRLRAPLVAIRGLAGALVEIEDVEVLHIPDTGILCFRIVRPGLTEEQLDALQLSIHDRIMAGGERTIALTNVRGRQALRLVAVSPAVTKAALLETVAEARRLAKELT